jgi:glycosyltransferase involved in cell wall biosynthesis
MRYVLITPARNEAAFIEKTLASMAAQTLVPERWVVVNDGSTDQTAEIVESYAKRYPWIELVRRPKQLDRSFAGKVHAFNAGLERMEGLQFDVIGNLDADLSFEADYLSFLMQKFDQDPTLGVAGTPFTEDGGYDTARDSFEGENYVAGGCQLFRHRCFEEIGGYVPNPAGGVDWIAVMSARMKGWKVQSFPEKRFHHYRSLGTAERGLLGASFEYGERAYYLGGSPVWHFFRCLYRMTKKPFFAGGFALMAGYVSAAVRRTPRPGRRQRRRPYQRPRGEAGVAWVHRSMCAAVLQEWLRLAQQEPDNQRRTEYAGLALVFAERAEDGLGANHDNLGPADDYQLDSQ